MARTRQIWAAVPLFLAFVSPTLGFQNDFSFYPVKAQSCMNSQADASQCSGSDANTINKCFCSNTGNFVLGVATCLGKQDPGDVDSVYTTLNTACTDSKTPLTVNKNDFESAASSAAAAASSSSSSSASGSTASKTSSPSSSSSSGSGSDSDNDNDNGSSGHKSLSTGAIAGIAVGGAVVGIAAIAGIAMFFIRRKKRNSEESHPMLPTQQQDPRFAGSTSYAPSDPSTGYATPFGQELKPGVWGAPSQNPSPDSSYRNSVVGGWNPPQGHPQGHPQMYPQGPYQGAYAPPHTGAVELPQQAPNAGHFHEMDATAPMHGAVEIEGSVPSHGHGGA